MVVVQQQQQLLLLEQMSQMLQCFAFVLTHVTHGESLWQRLPMHVHLEMATNSKLSDLIRAYASHAHICMESYWHGPQSGGGSWLPVALHGRTFCTGRRSRATHGPTHFCHLLWHDAFYIIRAVCTTWYDSISPHCFPSGKLAGPRPGAAGGCCSLDQPCKRATMHRMHDGHHTVSH